MAEYASAIAGLISFGLQLAGTIHKYASSAKHAKETIGKLQQEINSLNEVTKDLEVFVRDHMEVINPDSSLMLAISGCQAWLEDLGKQIPTISSRHIMSRVFHRLKWPFDEEETRQAAEDLHRFSQTFHFALTIQGFDALLKANADAIEKIQSYIDQKIIILDQNNVDLSLQLGGIAQWLGKIPDMMMKLCDIQRELQIAKNAMSKMVISEEFSKFLAWIPSTNHQDIHQQLQEKRLANSVQWFIKSQAFNDFISGDSGPVLWCPGAPGSGKTFLSSIIIDNLFFRAHLSKPRGHVAYFYFNYRSQAEQTPIKVLNSLLRQIIASYGHVPTGALDLFELFKESQSLPQWDELVRVLGRVCADDGGRTFIVLDALDECDTESHRKPILELVQKLSAKGARVCITSREFAADINEELENAVRLPVVPSSDDIRRLLQKRMKDRRISRKINKSLQEDIIMTILEKSQGMFLLPSLMIDSVLDRITETNIRAALRTLPTTLAEFYGFTLRVRIGEPGSARAQLAMATLLWVSQASRPLKLEELQHAVASTPGTLRRRDLSLVLDDDLFVSSCLGLVTLDSENRTLRFVHQSVNEYIQDHRAELFPNAQKNLAISCLTYLLLKELQEADPRSANQLLDLQNRFPFLEYAARNWGDHAREAFDNELAEMSATLLGCQSAMNLWSLVSTGVGDLNEEDYYIMNRKKADTVCQMHVAARFGLLSLVEQFISIKGQINARDHRQNTPLMLAARWGHLSVVKLLLSIEGLDKNAQNDANHTALCIAITNSRMSVVEYLLLDSEINVNLGNPLAVAISSTTAAYDRNESTVALLLTRSDVDVNTKPDGSHNTLFWDAVENALVNIVAILLGRDDLDPLMDQVNSNTEIHPVISAITSWIEDWDIMTEQEMINTMLIVDRLIADERIGPTMPEVTRIVWYWNVFHETFKMEYPAMTSWLHDHGIDASYSDSRGETFLHQAVTNDIDRVLHLLDLGVKPDSADKNGWSALHEALSEPGRTPIVKLLLDRGAKADTKTHSAWSVLHTAVYAGQLDYVSLLIDRGADVTCRSKAGLSPLDIAVYNATSPEIISFLLEKGADPHAQDSEGFTALYWAAQNPSDFPCRLLLEQGVEVDSITLCGYGLTPLNAAASMHHVEAVRLLIEAGADPTIIGSSGQSALDFALKDPRLWDAMSRSWTDDYTPTSKSVQQGRIKDFIGFLIHYMLTNEKDRWASFYSVLSHRLMQDGKEEDAIIGLRSAISTLRYPIGKREFKRPCDACQSNEMPFYFCKVCVCTRLCQDCMNKYPKDDMPWCREHAFLRLDDTGWIDADKGVIDSSLTAEQWLRQLQEKYPFSII